MLTQLFQHEQDFTAYLQYNFNNDQSKEMNSPGVDLY